MAVVTSSNPDFDFSQALMHQMLREAREWEVFGSSPLTSIASSPASSMPTSPSFSPLSTPTILEPVPSLDPITVPPFGPTLPPQPSPALVESLALLETASPSQNSGTTPAKKRDRKQKRKAAFTHARQKRRAEHAEASFGQYVVRQRVLDRYVRNAPVICTPLATENLSVDRKGFIGIDKVERKKKVFKLSELVGKGSKNFKLVKWDGRTPTSITDSSNRLIGVLAGIPNDNDWPAMHREAAHTLESFRGKCSRPKSKKKRTNRRGPFFALQCGVSHGGGQKQPKNLYNVPANRTILESLNAMRPFKRIAGFASAVMASHAPLLYDYYADRLGRLFERDRRLKKNFPSTIFAAATYNFGPRTECYEHTDPGNLSTGWCSVTPFGEFDYTKGGHLVLWDCHLVVQFPPGSTILLPSAIVAHSNTAIQPGEKRYSFALYSAGALFRWVENGFERSQDYYASLTEAELASAEASNLARYKFYLSLLPIVEAKDDKPHPLIV